MDLTKLDIKDLKSLAYDQMVELQRIQTNLQIINAEIAKRKEAAIAEAVKEEPKKEK